MNSLPDDKILDVAKLKAFSKDKVHVILTRKMIYLFDRVENTVGTGKKCWLPVFSPFPTVLFQKGFLFFMFVKSPDCVVKS